MITEEAYNQAVTQRDAAQEIINAYGKQRITGFNARWERFKKGEAFTDDDLRYSADARCDHCGAGLAYPKDCGGFHQWDCSEVLKCKIAVPTLHPVYPFAFYEIKSEEQPSACGSTTRPKNEEI